MELELNAKVIKQKGYLTENVDNITIVTNEE